MEINSIKDLIDALEQLGEPEDGYTRFFRGILMLKNIN